MFSERPRLYRILKFKLNYFLVSFFFSNFPSIKTTLSILTCGCQIDLTFCTIFHSWIYFIQLLFSKSAHIYTNGSKSKENTGTAFLNYRPQRPKFMSELDLIKEIFFLKIFEMWSSVGPQKSIAPVRSN